MFSIDKGAYAAALLGFCNHLQGQRRLAGRFRSINLNHPAPWQATNAQRNIKAQRAGGNRFHLKGLIGPQLHDRTLAEGPFNLAECGFQRLRPVSPHIFNNLQLSLRHLASPLIP